MIVRVTKPDGALVTYPGAYRTEIDRRGNLYIAFNHAPSTTLRSGEWVRYTADRPLMIDGLAMDEVAEGGPLGRTEALYTIDSAVFDSE